MLCLTDMISQTLHVFAEDLNMYNLTLHDEAQTALFKDPVKRSEHFLVIKTNQFMM